MLRDQRQKELQELSDLADNIRTLQQTNQASFKSQVEIAPGIFCKARVPSTDHMYVAVGLGFHVQCSLDEALSIVSLKREHAQKRMDAATEDVVRLHAHILLVEEGIRQLPGLAQ